MKLLEKISDPTNGIFNAIKLLNISSLKWMDDYTSSLDIDYLYNQSGDKELTFLGEKCDLPTIAKILVDKFGDNWSKIYQAFYKEVYNPVENYRMEEIETPDLIESITGTNTSTIKNTVKDDSNTNVNSNSEDKHSTDIKNTGLTNNGVYGFNSLDSVDSNTSTQNGTTVADLEKNKHLNNSSSDSIKSSTTINDGTDNSTFENSKHHSGTRTLTRSGNIGVTTSQQMLESELKLREWNLFNRIYRDVDSILCQGIYRR